MERLLGMSLKDRLIRSATRAGWNVVVAEGGGGEVSLEEFAPRGGDRLVICATNVVMTPRFQKTVAGGTWRPDEVIRFRPSCGIFDVGEEFRWIGLGDAGADAETFLERLSEDVARTESPPQNRNVVEVEGEDDRERAEEILLRDLIKDNEGFMSRHFERKISLFVTRRIVDSGITPNGMSLISIGVGLLGAPFFLSVRPTKQVTGSLLFLAHSILDGCDGELARLTFQESKGGGELDFWGDNLVHSAIFSAISIGWARTIDRRWPLLLGAVATLGGLVSAGVVYVSTMRNKNTDGPLFRNIVEKPDTRMEKAMDALARRDFIYLLLLLSLRGRAHWFLVAAALGAPLYALALLRLTLAPRPLAS